MELMERNKKIETNHQSCPAGQLENDRWAIFLLLFFADVRLYCFRTPSSHRSNYGNHYTHRSVSGARWYTPEDGVHRRRSLRTADDRCFCLDAFRSSPDTSFFVIFHLTPTVVSENDFSTKGRDKSTPNRLIELFH